SPLSGTLAPPLSAVLHPALPFAVLRSPLSGAFFVPPGFAGTVFPPTLPGESLGFWKRSPAQLFLRFHPGCAWYTLSVHRSLSASGFFRSTHSGFSGHYQWFHPPCGDIFHWWLG